ncbi:MAG: response regulator transcription factor [Verrucomicrobiota bacterium]|jgi:DNA-binding NarL/FixJ family response regulator
MRNQKQTQHNSLLVDSQSPPRPAATAKHSMPIAVSIVEDDARVRETLGQLVARAPGFTCVSLHADGESALKDLPLKKPQVVLMDINLPGMSGVECVRRLKAINPGIQVVMLTVYENTDLIFNALSAGASGYLLKQTPPEELLKAVEDVHKGGSPMTSHIARKVVQSFQKGSPSSQSETHSLSPREQEVLDLLSKGYLYKEIADQLSISFETVHTYIRRIYEKLHVRSRTAAVAKYLSK